MSNDAEKLMSLDEFLAWERDQPEQYEYAGGRVTMMTGGSAAHVTIALNLTIALRQALRGTGCRPFGSDMKVIANGSVRYPDVSVTCHPVDDRGRRHLRPGPDNRGDIAKHRARGSRPEEIRLPGDAVDQAICDHRAGRTADRPLYPLRRALD